MPIVIDKHVLGFDISMNNSFCVRVFESQELMATVD